VDDVTHQADQVKFDEVEGLADGLGPLYNAQSCRECHQNPTSGGPSQVTELRVGHLGPDKRFRNPEIPIGHGTETITGRSLVMMSVTQRKRWPKSEAGWWSRLVEAGEVRRPLRRRAAVPQ